MLKFLVLLSVLKSNQVRASQTGLEEFYKNFKLGKYEQAIDIITTDGKSLNSPGLANYLIGISYSKLQQFDMAVTHFELAVQNNSDAKDLYYEYGQALYATNNLRKAKDAFLKSAELNFNQAQSLYYVAHISQIVENFPEAEKFYLKIIQNKDIDTKLEQIAKFQLGETRLSILRESIKDKKIQTETVQNKILPVFFKAQEVDKSTTVSFDIEKRIKEIQKEFDLDPDLLKNGKRISSKRFNAYLDIKNKFDDNVTNSYLENDVQQSHKESFLTEIETEAKYDYVFKKQFIITPLARINYTKYSNQDESDVYKNDAIILTTSLKNKFETLLKGKQTSLIFDIDLAKTYKDYSSIHSKRFYSSATTFTVGETFNFSDRGDTTLKFKRKSYEGYLESLNNHTSTISVDQTLATKNNQLLIVLFNVDMVDNYNSTSSNTNAYMLRFDYIFPEILPKIMLTTSFAYTLTDTLEQKSTRGFESTINPSLEISKDINASWKCNLNFDYSKNVSKSSDYKYQKTVSYLELKYNF